MAWAESHQAIGHHPKTIMAAKLLGISIPLLVGHLHLLWHWALDFALSGDLTEYESAMIANGAMWEGDPDDFITALLNCKVKRGGTGFLERTEDGRLIIHDWPEYTGRLLESRRKNRERQTRYQNKQRNALVTVISQEKSVTNAQPTNQPNQPTKAAQRPRESDVPVGNAPDSAPAAAPKNPNAPPPASRGGSESDVPPLAPQLLAELQSLPDKWTIQEIKNAVSDVLSSQPPPANWFAYLTTRRGGRPSRLDKARERLQGQRLAEKPPQYWQPPEYPDDALPVADGEARRRFGPLPKLPRPRPL